MAVLLDRNTRLIVQGLTGREGTFHAKAAAAYHTNVVGGVTPGLRELWVSDLDTGGATSTNMRGGFAGLQLALGGRSLNWGGWSPELLPDEMRDWPTDLVTSLRSTYFAQAAEHAVIPPTRHLAAERVPSGDEGSRGARKAAAAAPGGCEAVRRASPGEQHPHQVAPLQRTDARSFRVGRPCFAPERSAPAL